MKRLILILMLPLVMLGQNYPEHKGNSYINDFANVIPDDREWDIDKKIRDFMDASSIEMTIVTVNTIGDENIDDYTNELFKRWGVGKKGLDNGVMVLAAIKDRKWRIEVGYGLEPWLTDGYTKRRAESIMVPYMKKGDFFNAFDGLISDFIGTLGHTNWDTRVANHQAAEKKRLEEESAAAQMRLEYARQQDKESQERMDAFLGGLPWVLGILALIGAGIYFAAREYNRRMEIKRAEEERLRRIAEAKSRNNNYLERFKNIIGKLTVQQKFKMDQLIKNMNQTVPTLEGILNIRDQETEEFLDNEYSSLKNSGDELVAQAEDALSVISEVNSMEEYIKTFPGLILDTKRNAETAKMKNESSTYRKRDWNMTTIVGCTNKAEKLLHDMQQALWDVAPYHQHNIPHIKTVLQNLKKLKQEAHGQLEYAQKYTKEVVDHLAYMEKAASYVAQNRNRIDSLVADARRRIHHSDVTSSTKRRFDDIETKASTFDASRVVDIALTYKGLSEIIEELEYVIRKANSDISDAEAERERIRRKKEDDERRRRAAASSSSSYGGSSYGGGSSFGGGSSSFGGGRSGGGGSSGGW